MYRKTALKILKKMRETFAYDHTYNTVNPDHFKHLSRSFYDGERDKLERLGFRHVADVEDETYKQQTPDPRTFLRIMTTRDGTVNAAICQIRPNLMWRLLMFIFGVRVTKTVEFQTELEDRTQVATTTVRSRDVFPNSPNLFRNFVKPGTPVEQLYQKHTEAVDRVVKESNVRPIGNSSLDKILGFENRQRALQREYLESIGWVTEDYLLKHGANKKTAKAIHLEVQRILAEERSST